MDISELFDTQLNMSLIEYEFDSNIQYPLGIGDGDKSEFWIWV